VNVTVTLKIFIHRPYDDSSEVHNTSGFERYLSVLISYMCRAEVYFVVDGTFSISKIERKKTVTNFSHVTIHEL
jgi:hypothetical protein